VERIATLEKTLKHDVIAFTRNVSESLGEEKK
jgi:adenylosuccinate lyase